jgi:lysophospholipid acyltransferase (LPLAT)-like uncharacterized protein
LKGLCYRISIIVLPRLYVALSRLWFASCRVRIDGREHLETAVARGTAIAAFWHYSMFYIFYNLRSFSAAVMVSSSRDGEYIARVAQLFGHIPVRGSSNKQGVSGLKHMLRAVRAGNNAGIVADGSQGPARVAQPGAILVASRTGSPIVPMAWAASRYIAFSSWDRIVMPLPFCRIEFMYGEPVCVPAGIKAADIEPYRLELENELNRVYTTVWERVGRGPHDVSN